jgi:decaprenyl-phosphate phosphoribosyltransferase
MKNYLRLLRVSHWSKNLLMFLPVFFSGNLLSTPNLVSLTAGFLCFSFLASAVYIINDFRDLDFDRSHPEKMNRPIAAGKISANLAVFIAVVSAIGSLSGAYFLGENFLIILASYLIINLLYSAGLKHVPVVDITMISLGFICRVLAGGVLAEVLVSHWIIIMTFLLSMFLGFAKRRDDVLIFQDSGKKLRKSIDGYNLEFINACMVLMAGVMIVSYILYTISDEVVQRLGTKYLYITGLFVTLGIVRYLQITFVENRSGNPTKLLLRDHVLQITILAWVLAFTIIIYVNK